MAKFTFNMPDVGEGVAEAEIVEWHVKPGDVVNEGDIIADVMTDKANVEVPAPVSGTVLRTSGEPGDPRPAVATDAHALQGHVAVREPQPVQVRERRREPGPHRPGRRGVEPAPHPQERCREHDEPGERRQRIPREPEDHGAAAPGRPPATRCDGSAAHPSAARRAARALSRPASSAAPAVARSAVGFSAGDGRSRPGRP